MDTGIALGEGWHARITGTPRANVSPGTSSRQATPSIQTRSAFEFYLGGFVDEYDTDGRLLQRVAQHGQLNAPWGVALAPASFGEFGGDLLVGNFGDGQIKAYEPQPDGSFERVGGLRDDSGRQIAIDGLWALQFGNDGTAGPKKTLFFTAGPNDENDGLFGAITAG